MAKDLRHRKQILDTMDMVMVMVIMDMDMDMGMGMDMDMDMDMDMVMDMDISMVTFMAKDQLMLIQDMATMDIIATTMDTMVIIMDKLKDFS